MKNQKLLFCTAILLALLFTACKKEKDPDVIATACIGALPSSVLIDSVFTFTTCTTGGTSYWWNFGDGTTSTLQSPTHSYSQIGTYTVTLSVVTATDSTTTTKSINCHSYTLQHFVGSFMMHENCAVGGNNIGYISQVSLNQTGGIKISNFGSFVPEVILNASVSGRNFIIPTQLFYETTSNEVVVHNGTGSISANLDTLRIYYDYTSNGIDDNCSLTAIRQ